MYIIISCDPFLDRRNECTENGKINRGISSLKTKDSAPVTNLTWGKLCSNIPCKI